MKNKKNKKKNVIPKIPDILHSRSEEMNEVYGKMKKFADINKELSVEKARFSCDSAICNAKAECFNLCRQWIFDAFKKTRNL